MREVELAIVANLRREYGEEIAHYTDRVIAKAWRAFQGSDEYERRNEDKSLFPEWCELTANS